jgi:hypothetical protein
MPSESQTRTKIIDLRLKDAGWDVLDRTQVIEEFFTASQASSLGTDSMVREESVPYGVREFSDYVLLGKNGKALAVVEAKCGLGVVFRPRTLSIAAPSRNTAPRSSFAGFKRAFGLRTRMLVLGACLLSAFAYAFLRSALM